MEQLTHIAQAASDREFVDYVHLLGGDSPIIKRLLNIIQYHENDAWREVFDGKYDTPQEVWSMIDGLEQDLRSAESMIKDQSDEIKHLSNRSVIELLANQESQLKLAQKHQKQTEIELEKERTRYELAKSKLDTWSILSN